jgi:hypothetical protein
VPNAARESASGVITSTWLPCLRRACPAIQGEARLAATMARRCPAPDRAWSRSPTRTRPSYVVNQLPRWRRPRWPSSARTLWPSAGTAAFPVLSDRSNRRGQHRGQQFARRYTAAHLRCRGGTGRGADHQIGGLCHIETSFGQACDDADLPRISGGPTTTKDQSNVVNHLHNMSARGNSCP